MTQQIFQLPVEKKIGQLFFVGISGVEINEPNKRLLNEIQPGGICLFARNIKSSHQTTKLIGNLLEVLPIKPLVSLDEEGGLVDRLRRLITPLPAAASIRKTEDAEYLAKITSELLRMLGFNMNFAPVVDVIDEERANNANGLYSRAFGKSKEQSLEFARAYLGALQNGGCLGCIKHFPGLGASETDSHEDLPVVNLTREDLFDTDLFPYRELFRTSQVHAVMVAHAAYPLLDLQETDAGGKLLPSSLSANFINRLLRRELGFDGLVITDDLEMGAILKNYGIGDACRMAIDAGADMLSICADSELIVEGFNAIVRAVKNGEIKETRIDESLRRIAHIKTLIQPSLPLDANRLQILSRNIAELNEKLDYNYGG